MDDFIFLLFVTLLIHGAYGLGVMRRTKKMLRTQMAHYERRLHIMAHSLYAPLGSIQNFTELLGSEKIQKDKNKVAEYIDIIDDNVVRMLETLRYYIDISRIENNAFAIFVRDYSLPAVVEERLHFYGSRAFKSSVSLKMHIGKGLPPKMEFDSHAVSNMIDRLLSCMIERSKADDTVTLRVFYIPSGETFASAAKESGIVCSLPEELPQLLSDQNKIVVLINSSRDIFEQHEMQTMFDGAIQDLVFPDTNELTLQALARTHRVGLMVVKRFAEAHGGTAGAFNCKEGSSIYFTLQQIETTGNDMIHAWK
ncbi:MAG: hypothetical protein G01um101448_31 [Parcubacteria group bacterium Gr01-1014_48]|nr:MAG: hypothetical protein Greene041614_393 [Parcubacteria group bacterium Greene0416_14]TSC74616.1 MAG: hypothetical protein G01um101448_31 [Parcubacteria group bacterium Gr01-1014_48]TSD01585.1 MAG: hypothetical protein Greene101415_165 [Parcubacteria group bacterium Greene1014_15]TSD08366.1 MAG: hypothetical protein Greene07144_161 [Parcubacteria group bacterium Greene0714_4]